jgi:hypothetical protein
MDILDAQKFVENAIEDIDFSETSYFEVHDILVRKLSEEKSIITLREFLENMSKIINDAMGINQRRVQ